MKIAVFSSRYPSLSNHYSHTFVHTRNKEYTKLGHQVTVFVPQVTKDNYVLDGVKVELCQTSEMISRLGEYDCFAIHLFHHDINPKIDAGVVYDFLLNDDRPLLHFFHGIDGLKIFKHRFHEVFQNKTGLFRAIYRDFYVHKRLKSKIEVLNTKTNVTFVFPSNWLKIEVQNSFDLTFNKTTIIPNGIDCEKFKFQENLWDLRYNILSIRPLEKAYACDLTLNVLRGLSSSFSATLLGKGSQLTSIKSDIVKNKLNVSIQSDFIPNNQIPIIHQKSGIYLASTKMDTQGVSACEAMASGLLTFSYNVGAVGEFIKDRENGFLAESGNFKQQIENILEIVENRNAFEKLRLNGRKSIENIDVKIVSQQELFLLDISN